MSFGVALCGGYPKATLLFIWCVIVVGIGGSGEYLSIEAVVDCLCKGECCCCGAMNEAAAAALLFHMEWRAEVAGVL